MFSEKLCRGCGASMKLVREHRWLGNGTIVQRKNPHHRMVFIECDNINAAYRNVEEITAASIEHLLIESKRRATLDFLDNMLLAGVKTVTALAGARIIARTVASVGAAMGYGNIKITGIRRIHGRDDYVTFRVEEPYSLPLLCGDIAGALNAIDRRDAAISYRKLAPDVYEITGKVSSSAVELKDRLERKKYRYKPGEIEIERCTECGGPSFLSEYRWDLKRGVILSRNSGHRKVMVGPAALESVIDELQAELGDTVPETVIEAQRRFVKTNFYSLAEASSEEGLRAHLALRGLGNLREMDRDGSVLSVRLENACLRLILVGLVKGIYELSTGEDAVMAWEEGSDGSLFIEARSAGRHPRGRGALPGRSRERHRT